MKYDQLFFSLTKNRTRRNIKVTGEGDLSKTEWEESGKTKFKYFSHRIVKTVHVYMSGKLNWLGNWNEMMVKMCSLERLSKQNR